ncbi:YhgE/Pip domain-containing protein [Adlercreutzia muris]|nr:YhgE/Pip domain-containing protein [Adlercreutzia muris]MCR2028240.1 YhgE/Pip domain-containing protein [Adlercreutzia muris]
MIKRAIAYLSVILAIFARDVKRVMRNPVALVIVLGMIAMPSAYAWYVVVANWDPYSNTAAMKVAVANEDAGCDSPEAGRLDVGRSVVDQLHDNHDMGWELTDRESAINGVYEGKYWAALVIPEDFSEDFASVLTGDFTQPTLEYYVDEKPSSIAPKVTDAAATAIERSINESFVKTVAEKVVDATQEVGAHAEDRGDAAESSLTSGIRSAHDTIAETRSTLGELVGTVGDTREAARHADDTLASLQDEVPRLLEAVGQSEKLLASVRSTANTYGTALSQEATDGALQLSAAATRTQRALGAIRGDVAAAEAATRTALAAAEELLADNQTLVDDLATQAGAAGADPAVTQALAEARSANKRLTATAGALRTANDDLASTAAALEGEADALDKVAGKGADAVRGAAGTFQSSVLPDLTSSLDALVEACGTLEGALRGLSPSLDQARSLLAELGDTLESSQASLATTSDSLATMEDNLARSLTDLSSLQNSAAVKSLAEYLKADPAEIGSFMAAPVALDTQLVYPVRNYGSGVAPFFTNLALWVAGFILMAMVKLRVDPEGLPEFTAVQAYFGRWLFYVVCGLAMGFVCCAGDLVLGIQCESPAAFIGAGLLTVFVDVNLMFALSYAFRHIGKAVAVILLIVQIPGSSGMFPIEMMPDFFRFIHPMLPFTYSIDAMREAIGGFYGMDYLYDMLWLGLLFVPLGFFIGLVVGRSDFNLNLMLDEKLGATDLLLAEPVTPTAKAAGETRGHFRTRTLIRALLDTDTFRHTLVARAERFRRRYPLLRRIGWAALIAQPAITFAIMVLVHADVNTRVLMLMAMVAGIIAVDAYLIIISYLDANLTRQLALANLSAADLQERASQATGIAAEKKFREGSGCSGRASSESVETAPWAASMSESCLSESECPETSRPEKPSGGDSA